MNALDVMSRLKEIGRLLGNEPLSQNDKDYVEAVGSNALIREDNELRAVLANTYPMEADRIAVVSDLYHKLVDKLGLGVTWMGDHFTVRWATDDTDLKDGMYDIVEVRMVITEVSLPRDNAEEVPQ